jgi:16S rRNA (guanine527-N7)-methyltransferase
VGKVFEAGRDAKLIDALARALGVALPGSARPALLSYVERVADWNQKLDLTAARTPVALVEVLLADALMLSDPALVPTGCRFVDVGSGAGAPAVALLALRPDLSATLVEPKHKRVAFLRGVLGALGYGARVQVLEARLDPDADAGLPAHDLALSRATLAPPAWLALGARLAPAVLVLVASEPLPEPPPGVTLERVREYRLPEGDRPRKVGLYRRGA